MSDEHEPRFGPLSLGGAPLGNLYEPLTDEQAWSVLETAWECGIRAFDTAPHYGLGLSERRIGRFLATKPRDEFLISTKVGRVLEPIENPDSTLDTAHHFHVAGTHRRVWDFSSDGVRRSLEDSLDRLGLDSVDVVYLHDPDEYARAPARTTAGSAHAWASGPPPEAEAEAVLDSALGTGLAALARLREQETVSAIGIGSKSTRALLAGVGTGLLDLVMIAGRFTLLEQPAVDELLPACRDRGVGVVNAAVFNSGLLATPVPSPDSHYEYGHVPADIFATAVAIAEVCREFGVDLPTAALRYPLREPLVRTLVAGAATPAQVRENHDRMHTPVPEELWATLRENGLIRL